MRVRLAWIGGLTALLGVATVTGVAGQSTHQHKDTGNYVLKRAYSHVESIRDELQRNPHEYDGHRRRAIEHLSKALAELDDALWTDDAR